MILLWPQVLVLLPICLWWLYRLRSRPSTGVPSLQLWTHASPGRARYLWVLALFRVMALSFLFLAFARPQGGTSHSLQVSEGIAIEMLIDVSSSMDMSMKLLNGRSQSRMEVAKDLVEKFIGGDGDRLQGREDDLIGLITFARYADTRSPLTFGHDALLQIVENLKVQERPNEDGTAYGDALALAAARLRHLDELQMGEGRTVADDIESRVIILLTDGENNSGVHMPVEAAGLAKVWGCKIYTISLGDSNMHIGKNIVDSGQLSPAEQILEHISKETGGIFRKAFDYESLLSVYEEIDLLERSEISTRNFNVVAEWFWLPLSIALLFTLAALVLEATYLRIAP